MKRYRFMKINTSRNEIFRTFMLIPISLVYALGINLFIVPSGFYTGGILGLSQLFRSFLMYLFDFDFNNMDISGIIFYAVNVPFLILAHKLMGRLYFYKSVFCITAQSLFLSITPIPAEPLLSDALASSLIGGAVAGAMMGLTLRMGACDGGMDLIGVLIVHQKKGGSVGNANLYVNVLVFTLMAVNYPISTLIYSLITALATSYSLDYFFTQNINEEVHIILLKDTEPLEKRIHTELQRSLTKWHGIGTYSGKSIHILYIIVDKYEVPRLKRLVQEYDSNAFIVENSGVSIDGNFEKHLQ